MSLHEVAVAAGVSLAAVAWPTVAQCDELAWRRVTLALGGVGYFDYGATLDDSGAVGIDLARSQVSDALGSMVGAGGGARRRQPAERAPAPDRDCRP